MTIYEFRTSLTTAAGSTSAVSLKVFGGLCRQVFVQANTATTVFRVNIQDYKSTQRMDYGFHTGMLNDNSIALPMQEKMTVNITNASPNDTFKVYLGIQE